MFSRMGLTTARRGCLISGNRIHEEIHHHMAGRGGAVIIS